MSVSEPSTPRITNRAILALAVPIMVSNVSTPLLGLVDTAVVGQLPNPAHIGAVALGALVFSFVFWAFGFLRMGTTGLTAQALGAGDSDEVAAGLGRALLLAMAAGVLLIAAQAPIGAVSFALLEGSAEVEGLARQYYDVRIWAAPATLTNYALLGWYIGRGQTRIALVLQIVLNVTNMVLDALFVLVLDWGVVGVAVGTLVAELTAAGVGLTIAAPTLRALTARGGPRRVLDVVRVRRMVAVNGDIMVRSLALVSAFAFFVSKGAAQGDVLLAANAVLMQLIATSAYFLDGIAFAAEALVGHAVGARDPARLRAAARRTTLWAAGFAGVISVAFAIGGPAFIDLLTIDEETRAAARTYLPWAAAAPIAGVWAFQLDGIFIGATRSADMRNAMLLSLGIFLAAWWLLRSWDNHGLWASLHVHYAARTLTLAAFWPRLVRSLTPEHDTGRS